MAAQEWYWRRPLRRRRFLALGVGATAAAITVACGGGKEEAKATPAAGAASPAAGAATQPTRQLSPAKVGGFVDRSGGTASIGNAVGDGIKDWNDYASANNLYPRKIEWVEIDHSYEVPKAETGYKRFVEQEKVVTILSYGTPITTALTPKAADDKIPLWTPGFGNSEVADAKRFPYLFVGVATYHAQAMALLQHFKDSWKDTSRKPKLIYYYHDNDAGRDPLDVIKREAPKMGFDLLTTMAIPGTATDQSQQMLEVKQRDPDFLLTHLFGTTAAPSVKAAAQVGFPVNRMYSMVWGIGEPDIEVAGSAAEGYHGLQFVAVASDEPEALKLIREHYRKQGKTFDDKKANVYYLRGVFTAILINEAVRLAGDKERITGEDVKRGAESIKDFKAFGMSSGVTITPDDHAGSRKVRLYQVKNGKLTLERDWFEGPKPS